MRNKKLIKEKLPPNTIDKCNVLTSHVLVKTLKKNHYIFDYVKKKTLLAHPLLIFFLGMENQKKSVEKWIQQWKGQKLFIEDFKFPRKIVLYYFKKYQMLKENGYFSELDISKQMDKLMTPEIIQTSLANLKQIVFETTDQCCLECEYCGYGKYYNKYAPRTNRVMNIKYAKMMIDWLLILLNSNLNHSHNRTIYISFYGGEPLMNFSFIREIVDYVNKKEWKHNQPAFSMTTNAIFLYKYVDFLVEHKFNLLISLDGDEDNNKYRVYKKNGEPAYHDILKNIQTLRENYPDYFFQKVNFNAVLHNRNSVSAIHEYFKTHFQKIPMISPLNNFGIQEEYLEEFRQMYVNEKESLYDSENYQTIEKDMFLNLSSIRELNVFLHNYNDFGFDTYNDLLSWRYLRKGFPSGTCIPFSRKLFITVNGEILCCERIDRQFILGFIKKNGIQIDFKKIADRYNHWFGEIREMCSHCYNAGQCTQCLFYLDLNQKNIKCEGFMGIKDFSRRLSSLLGYLENNRNIYYQILKKAVSN